jgi:hypothetical protein
LLLLAVAAAEVTAAAAVRAVLGRGHLHPLFLELHTLLLLAAAVRATLLPPEVVLALQMLHLRAAAAEAVRVLVL